MIKKVNKMYQNISKYNTYQKNRMSAWFYTILSHSGALRLTVVLVRVAVMLVRVAVVLVRVLAYWSVYLPC